MEFARARRLDQPSLARERREEIRAKLLRYLDSASGKQEVAGGEQEVAGESAAISCINDRSK
jgi:hypothetical protein